MKRRIERIKLKQICPKCTKTFEIELTNSEYKRNKYKKFCSRECANSKKWSEEHKQKLSVICKNSDKVKKANKVITEKKKKA